MDSVQLLLTVTLTVTTVFLIIVGIQLVFLIQTLRKTIDRVNTILNSYENLGSSLSHGLGEMQGFLVGLKSLFRFIDLFHQRKK